MSKRVHPTGGSRVTSGFRTKSRPDHDGTDYRAATGSTIKAAHDGIVRYRQNARAGTNIELEGDGVMTGYSHLSKRTVKDGARVKAGDKIGEAGATGNATGPHLHFYVLEGGKLVNPVTWLKAGASSKPKPSKGSGSSSSKGSTVLQHGTWNNPKVAELQRVLNAWYPSKRPALKVDGDYGTRTRARVMWYQQRAGLKVDGIAGPKTLGSLNIK